jgi:hypothetical protein
MTAEPAVVIPLQIDDEEGDHVSVNPQSRKSSMNTSGPNQGAVHHHHHPNEGAAHPHQHHAQHHAQPGQMLRRTTSAKVQQVTTTSCNGDEHSQKSFSYLHSPRASPRASPRRKIAMTSPTVSARFNYGESTSPGLARFTGVMPSPTKSQSSRLIIPNGLPQSPTL